MAKWYFVRHGQSEFNVGLTDKFNSSITNKGLEQARRAAMTLRDEIEHMGSFVGYVSPYTRCLQTALVLQKFTGIKFKVTHLLGETPEEIHRRVDTRVHNAQHLYPEFDWSHYPEVYDYGSEAAPVTGYDVYRARISEFVGLLKDDQGCVVCSHMTPTAHLLREICFGGQREPLTIDNCSISLVEDRKPVYIGKAP